MDAETTHAVAEQAKYDLVKLNKRATNKRQKLERELQKVDDSLLQKGREMDVLQREGNKHQRQLDVDRAALEQQQTLFVSQSERLVHERKMLFADSLKLKASMTLAAKGRQQERYVSVGFFGCCHCVHPFHA